MKKYIILILLGCVLLMSACSNKDEYKSVVNLDHLNFLNESVEIKGQEMLITHIYASPLNGKYIWVDAANEGITCIDDVARSAIVYLKHYESYKDKDSLIKAEKALNYVLYMQQDDGDFYNFLNKDLTINKDGQTSYKSFTWWAARGLWSLSYGYKVFEKENPDFAQALKTAIYLCNDRITNLIESVGEYNDIEGISIPEWFLNGASDVSSIALAGLAEYYEASKDDYVVKNMMNIGNAIVEFQIGDYEKYPFGMHPSWSKSITLWHEWGSHQTHALTHAGRVLGVQAWIDSAKLSADSFLTHMILTNRVYQLNPNPELFEQIAYGTNMYVQGYLELYKATGEDKYAKMAGITGAWFFGDNELNAIMYDKEFGYGFDGIDEVQINSNSGAESTIEALWALSDIEKNNIARQYLYYKKSSEQNIMRYLEAEDAHQIIGIANQIYAGNNFSKGKGLAIKNGSAIKLKFDTDKEQGYILYLSAEKNMLPSGSTTVKIILDNKELGSVDLSNAQIDNYTWVYTIDKATISRGTHEIEILAEGSKEETYAKVDCIYLYPVEAYAVWENNRNDKVKVIRDSKSKELRVE